MNFSPTFGALNQSQLTAWCLQQKQTFVVRTRLQCKKTSEFCETRATETHRDVMSETITDSLLTCIAMLSTRYIVLSTTCLVSRVVLVCWCVPLCNQPRFVIRVPVWCHCWGQCGWRVAGLQGEGQLHRGPRWDNPHLLLLDTQPRFCHVGSHELSDLVYIMVTLVFLLGASWSRSCMMITFVVARIIKLSVSVCLQLLRHLFTSFTTLVTWQ